MISNSSIRKIGFVGLLLITIVTKSFGAGPYSRSYCAICIPHVMWAQLTGPYNWCSGYGWTMYAVATDATVPNTTYSWIRNYLDCTTIPGHCYNRTKEVGTEKTFTPVEHGSYYCTITDLTTGEVTVTDNILIGFANGDPSISNHPVVSPKCDGESTTLSVGASGSLLSFKWEWSNSSSWNTIPGATSSSYTFNSSASQNQYYFRCTVINPCSTVYSNQAQLIVNVPPSITKQPVSDSICQDQSASFLVNATGTPPFVYKWQYKSPAGSWTDISGGGYSGAATSELTIPFNNIQLNGYKYRCVISGTCSPEATSNAATLTVNPTPAITNQPVDKTVCAGENVNFSITASGNNLSYTWEKKDPGGSYVPTGITSSSYTHVALATENGYAYRCKVSNNCGIIYSEGHFLTVLTPATVTKHPDAVALCEGSQASVNFISAFSASGNLQWEFSDNTGSNWANLPENAIFKNVSSNTLTVNSTNRQYNNYRFRCKITGQCSTVVSTNPAVLTIKTPPEIITQPPAKTVCAGDSVSLAISATGTGPMEYKWRQAGTGVTNWTSSPVFFIDETTLDNYGSYTCQVRNECAYVNPVTSDAAVLSINPAPSVSLGNDIHLCPGTSATLTPGNGYASYLWNTSQTSSSISVNEGGNYQVSVTDQNNCKNSDMVFVIMDASLPPVNLGSDMKYCNGEEVILDAGAGYDFYLWNTLATTLSIKVNSSGEYSLAAGRNNSVCRVSDTINIEFVTPYPDEEICMVMVDPDTEKFMIIWEKSPDVGIAKYQVFKGVTNDLTLVSEVMVTDTSVVVDRNSKPRSKTDAYSLVSIDSCGNASPKSPWHKPFRLQSNIGLNDVINLTWEPYAVNGEEYLFKSLVIYRGTDSTSLAAIDTISVGIGTNSYTDINPPKNVKIYYRIGGEKDVPCDPNHILGKKANSGPYVHSLSNLEDNRLETTGISLSHESTLRIYPNPMKNETFITWDNQGSLNYRLQIYDLNGSLVRSVTGLNSNEFKITRENLHPGGYIIELSGPDTFRGKLFVE